MRNNIFILYRSEFFGFYTDLNTNRRLDYDMTNGVKRSSTTLFSTSEEYIIIKHNK